MKRFLIAPLFLCTFLVQPNLFADPEPGDRLWNLAAENNALFCDIKSKTCDLDLTEIFTTIDDLDEKTIINTSQIEIVSSIVDSFDFAGTQTALAAALVKACAIEEHMQSANDNIINAKDAIGQFISATDIGTTGTTIGLPGKYILCEDVTFNPGVASNAITIAADNVELNLNGFTLRQGNATGSTNAIAINADNSNISIYNGIIKDATGNGIDIDTVSCVHIEDLLIENTGGEGIIGDSSSNVFINNVQVVSAGSDGMSFATCDNLIIQNSLSCDTSSSGIQADTASSRITIRNCLCAGNTERGIYLDTCNAFEIHCCFCPNNTETGIRLITCQNGLIKGNICNSNTLEGILLETNCTQIKLISNICIDNGTNGVELDTATNCLVFENIGLLNTSVGANFVESAGGPNTFLSNWALEPEGGINQNYVFSTSTINQVTIDQSGVFPSEPTKWQNIDMKT